MSLCDRCYAPGHCCKNLWLNAGILTGEDADAPMAVKRDSAGRAYPFRVVSEIHGPVFHRDKHCEDNRYKWGCDKLDRNGRCTIYAERPDTCRLYQPREDALCVHFHLEAGDDTGNASIDQYSHKLPRIDPLHETMDGFTVSEATAGLLTAAQIAALLPIE